jgi:hypothetical protein
MASLRFNPSGRWFKASSIPIKEGFISTGIWALLSAVFASALGLWGYYAHHMKSNIALEEWAQLMGGIVAQFVLMAIYLSALVFHRRRKNVTSFILLDWRWWVGLVVFVLVLKDPPLAWVWVGLIYQVRLRKKPRLL